MTKEKKAGSLSFRVPERFRKIIDWAAKYESERTGEKVSQSDFMLDALEELLELPEFLALILPESFYHPKGKESNAKMVTIRAPNGTSELLAHYAPRFILQSATKLLTFASLRKAYKLKRAEKATKRKTKSSR